MRLGRALLRFWFNYDYIGEGRQHMEETLRMPGPWPPQLQALAHHTLGTLAALQGDHRRGAELLEQSARYYRDAGDTWYLAKSLNFLAIATENPAAAEAIYRESLALRRALGDAVRISQSLMNVAGSAALRGDFDQAEALNREALALKRTQGDSRGLIIVLEGLGELARLRGDNSESAACCAEALTLCAALEPKLDLVTALEGLTLAAASLGQDERAARLAGAVAGVRRRFHLPSGWRVGTHPWARAVPDTYEACLEAARARLGEAAWAGAVARARR